jgi:hypothetical protein
MEVITFCCQKLPLSACLERPTSGAGGVLQGANFVKQSPQSSSTQAGNYRLLPKGTILNIVRKSKYN